MNVWHMESGGQIKRLEVGGVCEKSGPLTCAVTVHNKTMGDRDCQDINSSDACHGRRPAAAAAQGVGDVIQRGLQATGAVSTLCLPSG